MYQYTNARDKPNTIGRTNNRVKNIRCIWRDSLSHRGNLGKTNKSGATINSSITIRTTSIIIII